MASAIPYSAPDASGWGTAGELRYLELLPPGVNAAQPLPMLVLLHGMGGQPEAVWLADFSFPVPIRVIMPRAPKPHEGGFSWFDFDPAGWTPPEPLARGISHAAELLDALLEVLPKQRPTTGLPIVVGFSQGGMLSFALALHHPRRLRFALPISGWLPDPLWPSHPPPAGQPPIRALHGTVDDVVPIAPARDLTQRLKQLGYDTELQEFEGIDHRISPEMYHSIAALLRKQLSQ